MCHDVEDNGRFTILKVDTWKMSFFYLNIKARYNHLIEDSSLC